MNIALAAHDSKKILMQNLCIAYKHILRKHNIFATGSTGKTVEEFTGLAVTKYLEGFLGGEQQMATHIGHNDIDLVIYLCNPQKEDLKEPGILAIMALCESKNIPFATNLATAEVLLLALDRGDLAWREILK
ncbi:MAG: methylglyoxal synthase [Defluviitaleaceae bacterium]|nr:methylglyoxal synthase [Defluviitaleaceae bacterium]